MPITGDVLTHLMIDVAWLAVLLLAGKLIRAKVVLFQKLFLPASIIGGFLGLLLGPYGFG
ncbi:MAG: glutamate:sodium symporter, partial [Gemmatimonadales bacterium]|nr:glutamate:sodium symporter [Gemmatimonadales bacterium]